MNWDPPPRLNPMPGASPPPTTHHGPPMNPMPGSYGTPYGSFGGQPAPYTPNPAPYTPNPPPSMPIAPASTPDSPLKPVLAAFDSRVHGSKLLYHLLQWSRALAEGDADQATNFANDLLQSAVRERPTQQMVDDLHAAIAEVLKLRPARSGRDTSGLDGLMKGSESVDLYEPDPDFFYVRDKKSGADLEDVLEDLQNMERYIKRGARSPARLLFIGGPGSGKTMGARWLGSKLNKTVHLVRIDGTIGSMVGETSKRLRAACEEAVAADGIIVIDEFEAVAVSRAKTGPNVGQWHKETTSGLLQLLDSLPPTQIFIGATNVPEEIDSAVLRRLRKHVFFHPPDRDARAAMLSKWWKTAPHEPEAKRILLDLSEGLSGDFLERAAEDANRSAARRGESERISVRDVQAAVLATMAVQVALGTSTPTTDPTAPVQVTARADVADDSPTTTNTDTDEDR